MRCQVLKTFNRRGEPQLPGSIIEVPEDVFQKLAGYIKAVAATDTYSPAGPKAWLENDKLMTRGIFPGEWPDGGLTQEIIKLTADNFPLQAKLLRECVGAYLPGVHWLATIRKWREKASKLFDEGMGLHEANWLAASEMRLLAFADELQLKQPDTGEGAKYADTF